MEVGSMGINLMRTVMRNTGDERIRFVRSSRDLNNRIIGMNQGINDEVKGDYDKVRV